MVLACVPLPSTAKHSIPRRKEKEKGRLCAISSLIRRASGFPWRCTSSGEGTSTHSISNLIVPFSISMSICICGGENSPCFYISVPEKSFNYSNYGTLSAPSPPLRTLLNTPVKVCHQFADYSYSEELSLSFLPVVFFGCKGICSFSEQQELKQHLRTEPVLSQEINNNSYACTILCWNEREGRNVRGWLMGAFSRGLKSMKNELARNIHPSGWFKAPSFIFVHLQVQLETSSQGRDYHKDSTTVIPHRKFFFSIVPQIKGGELKATRWTATDGPATCKSPWEFKFPHSVIFKYWTVLLGLPADIAGMVVQ